MLGRYNEILMERADLEVKCVWLVIASVDRLSNWPWYLMLSNWSTPLDSDGGVRRHIDGEV